MKKIIFFSFFFVFIIIFSFLFSSAFAAPLPPKTATITGTVTDSITHNPIVDATVSISMYRTSFKTKTDTQGQYTLKIDILKPTFSIITAYKSGYSPSGKLLEIKPALTYTINFSLRDIAPPIIESLSIEGGASYTNKKVVTLTLVASDKESGLYQMSFSNDGKTWSKPESYTSTKNWTLTDGDGLKTVYAKVKDKAGHWSKPVSSSITLDTTPPTTPQVTDDGIYTTSSTSLHASWTSYDVESGIVEYQYSIGTAPADPNWNPDCDFDGNGVINMFDFSIFSAAFGSQPGDDNWNPDCDLDGNGVINMFDHSIFSAAFDSHASDDSVVPWTEWIQADTNREIVHENLSLTHGQQYFINVIVKNGAGIKSNEGHSDGITVDSVAPSGTITINNDAQYTNSVQVVLNISATDSVSGLDKMQFSNDGTNYSTPEDYATSKSYTLPSGDGTKTVYAKFKDVASNWSTPVNDTIILDTTAPVIDITSPIDGTKVNTSTITVSGSVSDNLAQVTVNGISAQVTNYTFTASGIALTEGTNIITAKATKDTQTAQDTINVILDLDPPSINIYTPDNNSTTRSNIVYGRVSDDTQTVTVNGTSAELLNDFRFIARPTLNEGQNTITVQATDLASNSNQASINITYNTTAPKVVITSPLDNSEINISPIKVEGASTSDIQFILVEASTAIIDNLHFTAEGVTLDSTKTVITAEGYDANNFIFQDSIVVTSPALAHYELQKISGDATEDDPNRPQAGSDQTLIVKLNKNNLPAPAEEIQFRITQGNGALSNPYAFTDINGEAQVTITLDTNSDVTNQVEAYPTNNPLVKTTFFIDTQPATPAILTKITDDSITPVPGATIDLIVKLTDQNQNPIPNEIINFQVISGDGTLSSSTATTTYYGEAKVNLTCPNLGLTLTQIQASSQTVPSVIATFNITTSAPLTVTVQDIIDKVNYNDSKIQDIKADITVTSNAPFLPPTMQLKIWQKRDKQKVEEISPNPRVKIRPISSQILQMNREIILCNSSTNIYVIKSKLIGQADEYPYDLDYVDYQRGIVVKTERHFKVQQDIENLYVVEYLDFLQFNDIWGFQKIKETMYDGNFKKEYYIIKEYSNIQINAGIPDTEFN